MSTRRGRRHGPPATATGEPAELGVEVQPDAEYFDTMARMADDHWWYRTRRDWLVQELRGRVPRGEWALDVGCGTGQAMATLESIGACPTVGTDLSDIVLREVVRRDPRKKALKALAGQLPFPDGFAGTVMSLEVIEHLDDDAEALAECFRVLRPGGLLYVTVPAYEWLWGEHDDRAAHRRRYDARRLVGVVEGAGFVVERTSYYFSFLVPPAFLVRRTPLKRFVTATEDEVSVMHPALEAIMAAFGRIERAIGRRWRIPFGLSILVIAHKPPVPSPNRSSPEPLRRASR